MQNNPRFIYGMGHTLATVVPEYFAQHDTVSCVAKAHSHSVRPRVHTRRDGTRANSHCTKHPQSTRCAAAMMVLAPHICCLEDSLCGLCVRRPFSLLNMACGRSRLCLFAIWGNERRILGWRQTHGIPRTTVLGHVSIPRVQCMLCQAFASNEAVLQLLATWCFSTREKLMAYNW